MIGTGTSLRLVDNAHPVVIFGPVLPASGNGGTATVPWINLANYNHVTFVINCLNTTTVTGSAITFNQASDTSATGSVAFSPTLVWANTDTVTNTDVLTQTAVVSGTFTTSAVNSKSSQYIVEIDTAELTSGLSCVQLCLGNAAATVISVVAICSGAGRRQRLALPDGAVVIREESSTY